MSESASFAICNTRKIKPAGLNDVRDEKDRLKDDPDWYKNDVDLEKSKYNVYFENDFGSTEKVPDWKKAFYEVCESYGITDIRPDANAAVNYVLRASPEWYEGKSQEEIMALAQNFYNWVKNEQPGFLLNCVWHVDEGSPHLEATKLLICKTQQYKTKNIQKKDKNGEPIFEIGKNGKKKPVYERYINRKTGKPGAIKREKIPVLDENGKPVYRVALNTNAFFGGGGQKAMHELQNKFWERCGKPFGLERGKICFENDEEVNKKRGKMSDLDAQINAINNKKIKATKEAETAVKSAKTQQEALDVLKAGRRQSEAAEQKQMNIRKKLSQTLEEYESAPMFKLSDYQQQQINMWKMKLKKLEGISKLELTSSQMKQISILTAELEKLKATFPQNESALTSPQNQNQNNGLMKKLTATFQQGKTLDVSINEIRSTREQKLQQISGC